jgi:hypothetical protein
VYARVERGVLKLPTVPDARYMEAKHLIERVGGKGTYSQFLRMLSDGWKGEIVCDLVHECVQLSKYALSAERFTAGNKRKRLSFASLSMRKAVWEAAKAQYPTLSEVALRALSIHPTSCASERNWKLWGRVYTASRTALGKNRAQKMITFCFNNRAQKAHMEDMGLQLAVIEGNAHAPTANAEREDSEGRSDVYVV